MKQFIKFGIVGAINAVLNYIIYIFCISIGFHYILSNIIGFFITIFNAFLLQSKFVFNSEQETSYQSWWKILIRTYISYAFTGIVLTNMLSILWIEIIHTEIILYPIYEIAKNFVGNLDMYSFVKYVAPILNMIITIPMKFLINKYWTYKNAN